MVDSSLLVFRTLCLLFFFATEFRPVATAIDSMKCYSTDKRLYSSNSMNNEKVNDRSDSAVQLCYVSLSIMITKHFFSLRILSIKRSAFSCFIFKLVNFDACHRAWECTIFDEYVNVTNTNANAMNSECESKCDRTFNTNSFQQQNGI